MLPQASVRARVESTDEMLSMACESSSLKWPIYRVTERVCFPSH